MFTAQQQLLLTELGLGTPEPFLGVDFKRPFVYDPKYGVFYCASGQHHSVMATLYCFHKGYTTIAEATEQRGLTETEEWAVWALADLWLEHYHGCFKSSCSCRVDTWSADSMEEWEQNIVRAAKRDFSFYATS